MLASPEVPPVKGYLLPKRKNDKPVEESQKIKKKIQSSVNNFFVLTDSRGKPAV